MENISLTMEEQKRVAVIQKVFRAELTMGKASLVLGVSERQCYRIKARVKQQGVKGVVHGNRGRPCGRKVAEKTVKRIVELAKGKYRGLNDHHLTEKLQEEERIKLSREKIRLVLRAHGIGSPRKKRPPKHRSRRVRREAEGMMIQVDGSPHDWLEGRGPRLCLIGGIDDATSRVAPAFFEEQESSAAYFRLFLAMGKTHGLPLSVYADRHAIFWTDREPTVEEQLKGKRPTTEVGRGLEELSVTLIPAGSPQAKGRIERLWGTFQDRLVSELRLAGARSKEQAQAVLERFLPDYNRKFSKPALKAPSVWRNVSATQLERSLCFKFQRTVAKDHTVSFEGTILQIPKRSPYRSYANKRINVHVLLDGAVEFFYQEEKIARFDAKTTHALGLYRTNGKRQGFRYGPPSAQPIQLHETLTLT